MSHTDYSGDEPLLEDGYDDPRDSDDWSYEEPRKRRARSCLPVLLVLVILGSGLYFGGRWAYDELSTRLASAPDYEGPGSGEVVYQVEEGVTSAQIGRDLKEAGVVASVDAFTEAANLDEDSRSIQVGYYQLQQKMKASDALDVLVDPANLVQALVTVPEGARVRQVVDSIAENTDIRRRAVVRALADAEAIGLPADAAGNPEGYLFPATYTVPPKMTAVELISQMVAKTKAVETDLDIEARAADLGLTPEQVLTVASILEYEANKSEDYPRVARVLYNRLDDDMALQLDSTVSYVSGRSGDVWTTSAERDSDSQYNTYKYTGLPPGPIGSPGQETIEAALEPAQGDWLFFVPDYEADTTRFSETLAEHNRWVEKLREYCRTNEDC
ncbi:hypothetical protein ASG49_06605 [Marmoricola sp. Leaf446]|uniref:endolytic transglycosylase MltG n=1 Tax=Marmoricola sp. Leaf446 TaxID=1736379 RepID=UPI0006F640C2|nr:endolytic transglycosylase MltG [Marmoricola sp. Leaf446]KQT94527.1 hypothetical protein ASG49_06605 [Marmoricola sp. Leaf446]